MNRVLLVILAGAAVLAQAQTGPGAQAAKEQAKAEVDIVAAAADFDIQNRGAVFRGQVRATDPQMTLTCETLTARWSETNRITSLVAEGSVVIEMTDRQERSQATSERAEYAADTELVVLAGQPKLINRLGTLTSERMVLDRKTGKLRAVGNVRIVLPSDALSQPGLFVQPKAEGSSKPGP
jgi:lipopolysaccharide transport protein LptA